MPHRQFPVSHHSSIDNAADIPKLSYILLRSFGTLCHLQFVSANSAPFTGSV